jgi:3-mercaptopropionate dioxygenase
MKNYQRFRSFVGALTNIVEQHGANERLLLQDGEQLLGQLIANDDWLPDEAAVASSAGYRQYLLHCDARERFSVVSFVWGPGQKTPIHDHTVWGLVGVMRGAEQCEEYEWPKSGQPMLAKGTHRIQPGEVDKVSPTVGDIHVVSNAFTDRTSISIHVYGANIGAVQRHIFDGATGAIKSFVSGYHNTSMPNFWDRSTEVMASR